MSTVRSKWKCFSRDEHCVRSTWIWPAGILLLGLALRLIWVRDTGYSPDVSFFVRWMRLATQGGIGQVYARARSSYPPLSVYLLWVLGLFSQSKMIDVSPTPVELLALRAAIISFDLLMIALLYALGRHIASHREAAWAALLYTLCPGGIYLSGWWVQTEAWFTLPMVLAAWWLAHKRIGPAWIALGVAMALKLQTIVVLPIFVIGTWRWWGVRRLILGGMAFALALGGIVAPILLQGQGRDLLSTTMQPVRYFEWISIQSHNLWFALTPRARDLDQDVNRDLNAFVGGVSFRDVGLALLALSYGLIVMRLFIRSGPGSIFATCAVVWLTFFTLPTRIDARYLFPALPLMLCAGFYQRRWWALYAATAVTLLITLVWKSQDASPLRDVLLVTPERAVANAWSNVVILGLALVFYIAPLLGSMQRQADNEGQLNTMERSWEVAVLATTVLILLGTLGAVFWRGRTVGARIARMHSSLHASLDTALEGTGSLERVVVINWPHVISADRSVRLGGVIPVVPPAFFGIAPDMVDPSAAWVQYPPWQQSTEGLQTKYYGDYVTQAELVALVQPAQQVVTFSPQIREMFVLAQTRTSDTPPTCLARFDEQACLIAAQITWRQPMLQVELEWQVTGTLPADVTAFVHIVDVNGSLIAQSDGDLVGGLVPLASQGNPDRTLYETRLVSAPPGDYWLRIGVYDRVSGERLAAHCQAPNVCVDNAIEIKVPV